MARKTRSKLNEAFPELGPGIFDARREPSLECVEDQLRRFSTIYVADVDALMPKMAKIVNHYWNDSDNDNKFRYSDMKSELGSLMDNLSKAIEIIECLSPQTIYGINLSITQKRHERSLTDYVSIFYDNMGLVRQAGDKIAEEKYAKREALAVLKCCSALWKVREQAEGRKFVRNWAAGIGRLKEKEFTSPDALFVQVVVQAIDPKARFSAIRTGLKAVAEKEFKVKSNEESETIPT